MSGLCLFKALEQLSTRLTSRRSTPHCGHHVGVLVGLQPHPLPDEAAPEDLLPPHEGGEAARPVGGPPHYLQQRHLEGQVQEAGHTPCVEGVATCCYWSRRHLARGDDICRLSVSPRDRDDIIQIWNYDAKLSSNATVLFKIHFLVPEVQFLAELYNHWRHAAFEGKMTASHVGAR